MRFAFLSVLVLLMAAPVSAQVVSPTARQKVERLLGAYHGLPSAARLAAAGGPEVDKLLRIIATDESMFTATRAAAFEALKRWPDARTLAAYEQAITPENPMGLRHKVLRYLSVFGEAALDPLGAALRDPNAQIRLTAAYALFDVVPVGAEKLLRDGAQVEVDPTVRSAMLDLLRRRASVR